MDHSAWDVQGLFADEDVLHEHYTPTEIPEREDEKQELVKGLRRAFRGTAPKNMFLLGKTGQGKTATVRHTLQEFSVVANERNEDIATLYHSCSKQNSSYQVASAIVENHTGSDPRGHSQQVVFERMYDVFEEMGETVVVVLDEIDNIGDRDDLLYDIPRARNVGDVEGTKLGIIGITNDSSFLQDLDPRAKSSLYDRTIQFDAYDAHDLEQILRRRVKKAFEDGVVDDKAIPLCAALAARDMGNARQAIDYLYEAGEVALEEGSEQVLDTHVRTAEERVERRNVIDSISGLTTQDHLALAAVVSLAVCGDVPARTREVYVEYTDIAHDVDVNAITMKRVRDHLLELDLIGILDGSKRAGGSRGGKRYYWDLRTDLGATLSVIQSISRLSAAQDRILAGAENRRIGEFT